jgi:hypothetical protein
VRRFSSAIPYVYLLEHQSRASSDGSSQAAGALLGQHSHHWRCRWPGQRWLLRCGAGASGNAGGLWRVQLLRDSNPAPRAGIYKAWLSWTTESLPPSWPQCCCWWYFVAAAGHSAQSACATRPAGRPRLAWPDATPVQLREETPATLALGGVPPVPILFMLGKPAVG